MSDPSHGPGGMNPSRRLTSAASRRPGPCRAPSAGQELTLPALLKAFRRRWLVAICLGIIAAATAATATWLWLPAKYTAFAMLRLAAAEPRLVFPQSPDAKVDLITYQRTQASLIKSPLVINAALREPRIAQLSLVGGRLDPVHWLSNELKVEYTPGSEILRLAITGEKPEELAALANAVKEAYINECVNAEQQQRRAKVRELEQVFSEAEEKMRRKRNVHRQLARSLGTSDSQALTLKQQLAVQQYGELKREHTRLSFELMRTRAEALAQDARSKVVTKAEAPEAIVEQLVEGDSVVQQSLARIAQLQDVVARFESLAARSDDAGLVKYRDELEQAKAALEERRAELRPAFAARLKERVQADADEAASRMKERLALLADQEKLLGAEVDRYSKGVDKIGASSSDLEAMRAEIEQGETIQKRVGNELEAAKIEARSRPRVTVLQDAETPQSADGKRQTIAAAVAGAGGFALAAFLVSFLEFRARRIHRANELADELGLRVLGVLPLAPRGVPGLAMPGNAHGLQPVDVRDLGDQGDLGLFTDSIDAIRTVLLHEPNGDSRVVMITSAVAGEGKTTLACHLAASLFRAGRKTLLIDCDLRRPRVHLPFRLPVGPGLGEVLRGEAEVDEVIRQPEGSDLSVLTAGRVDREVIQALGRNGVQKIIEMMKLHFDFVILDAGPVLPIADALMIGPTADSAILAVMRGLSQSPKIQAALARLAGVGVRVLGAVVHGEPWHLSDRSPDDDYYPLNAQATKADEHLAA